MPEFTLKSILLRTYMILELVLNRLEILEHLVYHGNLWTIIASGVVIRCCNVDGLDDALLHKKGEALAPRVAKD